MSTDVGTCHIVYGGSNFTLKCGKNRIASAKSLAELENKIHSDFGGNEEYLIALDIFRTKNPKLG